MRRIRYPIGQSDFRNLREEGLVYVDKSAFIEDVLDEGASAMLFPRPRRFGKTLNLSMLRYFFEKTTEDRRALFAGLAVERSEAARPHFQRYPVIFLTFKDIKPTSWEGCVAGMGHALAEEFERHAYLLNGGAEGAMSAPDTALFNAIRERRAGSNDLVVALRLLCRLLADHHKEKVVLLLDEYDTPIHAGYTQRYYDDVVAFFRDFLSGGFKDNTHLFKGVLTGILRVAKESLFSGLNNIDVFSILHPRFATAFGFTEPEVLGLLTAAGKADKMEAVRAVYNGYLFGGIPIYNPWSVLSFLNRGDDSPLPYWIETSSNDLVRELLLTGPSGVRGELSTLLSGGTIDKPIEENIVLRDIARAPDAVWSFLLFTGYLKVIEKRVEGQDVEARLAVPNAEIASALRKMARQWMGLSVGGEDALAELFRALLRGDAEGVEARLTSFLLHNLSFFDAARPEPEKFYHGLVVGLLAGLDASHDVRSNRESGFGRCDVLVLPKKPGEPGVAMELKRVSVEAGETVEKALRGALAQLRKRDYAAELRARGASPIFDVAAVFEGKRAYVRVRRADAPKPPAKRSPAKKSLAKKPPAKTSPRAAKKKAARR